MESIGVGYSIISETELDPSDGCSRDDMQHHHLFPGGCHCVCRLPPCRFILLCVRMGRSPPGRHSNNSPRNLVTINSEFFFPPSHTSQICYMTTTERSPVYLTPKRVRLTRKEVNAVNIVAELGGDGTITTNDVVVTVDRQRRGKAAEDKPKTKRINTPTKTLEEAVVWQQRQISDLRDDMGCICVLFTILFVLVIGIILSGLVAFVQVRWGFGALWPCHHTARGPDFL